MSTIRFKKDSRSNAADDGGRSFVQERVLNDPARRSALRERLNSDLLPKLPEIPGFHTCWLSTANKQDSIRNRTFIGYVPVVDEDIPEEEREMWSGLKLNSGEFSGLISVNEMVAYKLPNEIYHELMMINHHDKPLEEEEALVLRSKQMAETLESSGSRMEVGDGMKLDRPVKRASFAA